MFFNKGPNPNKAAKLEKKADRLVQKGKFQKALKLYRKSESLDPDRPQIYQKLHETFQKIEREWTQEDFELSMTWTMRQQELEHPEIKQV
ncbi:MAG: tetratricopeptide repeat protein, partial [bacterium]|nr:tetratricopeptide repeat protein [bacterium]